MRYRDFDEDDVPMRPSRRGSRPRTKRRPEYLDAVPGMVTAIDRGRITVLLEAEGQPRTVTAIKALSLNGVSRAMRYNL